MVYIPPKRDIRQGATPIMYCRPARRLRGILNWRLMDVVNKLTYISSTTT